MAVNGSKAVQWHLSFSNILSFLFENVYRRINKKVVQLTKIMHHFEAFFIDISKILIMAFKN